MIITVVLLTWSPSVDHLRSLYARRTLTAALGHLKVGDRHELRWHVADDGSDVAHLASLMDIFHNHGIEPTRTNAARGGYGRSYNLMTQALHGTTDLVLCLEDDWELSRDLLLDPLCDAFVESAGRIGCIRLGYLGTTSPLRGTVEHYAGQTFLALDPDSPERHVFAGHPRLESVHFERNVGPWPEGLAAGATEFEVCGRRASREGVVWPMDLVKPTGDLFPHIGTETVGELVPGSEVTA